MGTRGRKSTAGLPTNTVPALRQRLPAPADLTPRQAGIWCAIVASRPVDWFDAGSAALLVAYCRVIEAQAVLAGAINALDPATLATKEGAATFGRLLALQDAQARGAIRLATSMRLSQHSRKSADAAATAARQGPSAAKLWDRHEG